VPCIYTNYSPCAVHLKIVPYVLPSVATNITTGKQVHGFFLKSKLIPNSEPLQLDQKIVSLNENVHALLRKYAFATILYICAFSIKLRTHAICGLDYGVVTDTA